MCGECRSALLQEIEDEFNRVCDLRGKRTDKLVPYTGIGGILLMFLLLPTTDLGFYAFLIGISPLFILLSIYLFQFSIDAMTHMRISRLIVEYDGGEHHDEDDAIPVPVVRRMLRKYAEKIHRQPAR